MSAVWQEVKVQVPLELSDAISNFLFELGASGLIEDTSGNASLLTAYFPRATDLEPLHDYLAELGVDAASAVSGRAVPEEDWSQSWKTRFRPLAIGERFWVHPPWIHEVPPGRLPLCIEPGMAFGTGEHETTQGCLLLIEEICSEARIGRALDLGTGTGILAIALARLGVPHVVAADNDATARQIARAHAERNGVADRIAVGEAWQESGPYDLIVANLFADLLCELAPAISRASAPAARLVLSGYLEADAARVENSYRLLGWSTAGLFRKHGWVAHRLVKAP
jgi:ribosomal protein L11 methyltransferase